MIKIDIKHSRNPMIQFRSSTLWYWVYAYKNHNRIGGVGVREDGFIHDLFVKESYRNKQVATRLLLECEKLIDASLYFYHQKDTPFGFYKKIGFMKRNGKLIRTNPNTGVAK